MGFRSEPRPYWSGFLQTAAGFPKGQPSAGSEGEGPKLSDCSKIHLIVNPVSGRSGRGRIIRRIGESLNAGGGLLTLHETRKSGDCHEFARQAAEAGADALIVVGGDGTICEAAGGVFSALGGTPGCPILVVASGTENLLAKYLGIPADADALLGILHEGRAVTMDLAFMNDRPFLMVAGMGFDAEVVRRLSASRRGHISYLSYAGPLWRTFWSYKHPEVSVEVDGSLVFEGRGMVFVGNIPRYAIGLRLLAKASPFDGLLDVCVFECAWQATLLRHSLNVLLRRHIATSGVVYRQARRVVVRSARAVDVELDGDLAGALPAVFEIRPSVAQFLVSAEWSSTPFAAGAVSR